MDRTFIKVAKTLAQIRTPLALSGLVVLVLYSLYQRVLNLGIFSTVNEENTFRLIDSFLRLVFWLALVSVILGVLSYIIPIYLSYRGKKTQSSVSLIDARVDPQAEQKILDDSNNNPGDKTSSVERNYKISDMSVATSQFSPFPAVDFKFVNRGEATAFLWKVGVEVIDAQIDVTPILNFKHTVEKNLLLVRAHNYGWGTARKCELTISQSLLNHFFSESYRRFQGNIASNEAKQLVALSMKQVEVRGIKQLETMIAERSKLVPNIAQAMSNQDRSILEKVSNSALFSYHEKWHVQEFFDDLQRQNIRPRQEWHIKYMSEIVPNRIPLPENLPIKGDYYDELGKHYNVTKTIDSAQNAGAQGELWISKNGFSYDPHPVHPSAVFSKEAYVAIVSPEKGYEKAYALSRKIPPGDIERFHIILGSTKSAKLQVRFKFYIDETDIVFSKPIGIEVTRPVNQRLANTIEDGARFELEDGVLKLIIGPRHKRRPIYGYYPGHRGPI